jgi:hypothetical protein
MLQSGLKKSGKSVAKSFSKTKLPQKLWQKEN